MPTSYSVSPLDDVSLPLSLGADRLTGFSAELILPGGAGGSLQDLSFIPQYRDDVGVTGTVPRCASWTWRRDALLDGHAAETLAAWPAQFESVGPAGGSCFAADKLKLIAETELDEQLADHERESGDLHAAVEDYTTALDWTPQMEEGAGIRPEVLNNNAALAYLGLDDTSSAASLESKALAADPEDPVFLMTAGFIADRAGRVAQAAQYDREALGSDPGAFPAANDLAVELTREHQVGAAVTALRQAVGASPGYALGWFNLGAAESRLGPANVLASQGAFATAYALDPALKSSRPEMTIDARVYRTALDLSKPLPPQWSFSQLQRPAPAAAVGLLALVVLGFGLARASGPGGSDIAGKMLKTVSGRLERVHLLDRLRLPAWGLAATGAAFLLAYLRRGTGLTEVATYTVGVLVLAVAAMTARAVLARRWDIAISQRSWPPALVLGLLTGAFGLPWAPLPFVRADGKDKPRLHLVAPILLATLSLLLFVESAWLHTPIAQAWAVASLIMAASTLLPVGPLDGAHVGKAGIAPAAGIAGGALLVGLGLI